MNKSFTISKVSWLTKAPGNEGRRDPIVRHFFFVTKFLHENGLTRRDFSRPIDEIDDDFSIQSNDLTEEGLEVLKAAYDKWLKKVDKGMDPADVAILENSLQQLRSK